MNDAQLPGSVAISRDVVFRDLDGEAVILDLASGVYFGLDPVGTRMWQLIEQHGVMDEVVRALCEEYDAPRETIAHDLETLVTQLLDKQLLVPAPPEAS